jgi:hypothetical protein
MHDLTWDTPTDPKQWKWSAHQGSKPGRQVASLSKMAIHMHILRSNTLNITWDVNHVLNS